MDFSSTALLIDNKERKQTWIDAVYTPINKTHSLIACKQLVGILLLVFMENSLAASSVSHVSAEYVPTGGFGFVGNKGAAGIRLQIFDSVFCFVNAHLSASENALERRNFEFADISQRLLFNELNKDGIKEAKGGVWNSDYLFWFGDLNYRLSLERESVIKHLEEGSFDLVRKSDQLVREMQNEKVFVGFKEASVNFPPTYKFDIETNNFDTSAKLRCPAWTDRVLWKSEYNVKCISYECYQGVVNSDHKPVWAMFEVTVPETDREKRNIVQGEILRELSKDENMRLPTLTLSTSLLEFGEVRFGTPNLITLELENTGVVDAEFEFENHDVRQWVVAVPKNGMVPFQSKIVVGISIVPDEGAEPQVFSEVLLLKVRNGSHHFLLIEAAII